MKIAVAQPFERIVTNVKERSQALVRQKQEPILRGALTSAAAILFLFFFPVISDELELWTTVVVSNLTFWWIFKTVRKDQSWVIAGMGAGVFISVSILVPLIPWIKSGLSLGLYIGSMILSFLSWITDYLSQFFAWWSRDVRRGGFRAGAFLAWTAVLAGLAGFGSQRPWAYFCARRFYWKIAEYNQRIDSARRRGQLKEKDRLISMKWQCWANADENQLEGFATHHSQHTRMTKEQSLSLARDLKIQGRAKVQKIQQ